jgi:predicted DNA-binding transcriptional regulator
VAAARCRHRAGLASALPYASRVGHWTFLTNHAHVLMCVARDPGMRLREVADTVGITERAAQKIITDLVQAGYLERERVGRRNHYRLNPELPLRHPMDREHQVGEILRVFSSIERDA